MASYKFTFYRYLLIDRCIGNPYRPFPSRQAILEHIRESSGQEISERQLDYDLQEMRNSEVLGFYAPIEFSRQHNGYYYKEKGYTIGRFIRLQEQDYEALDLAMQMLEAYRNIPGFSSLQQAIDKLRNGIDISRQVDHSEQPQGIVQQEMLPAQEGNQWLVPVIRLIREGHGARMQYRKFGQEPEWYHILPGFIREFDNRWYLAALLVESRQPRVFAFDRIVGMQDAGKPATPAEFDFPAYFTHVFGVSVEEGPPEEVELFFDHRAARYLLTKPLHHSQQALCEKPEGMIFSYKLIPNRELINFILSWGKNCRVIKPLSLENQVCAEAKAIVELYGQGVR